MWPVFDRCSTSRLEITSQQETLEHISTIAGSVAESLGSISHGPEEPIYDTDHTDLNSDYDEAELRRELLKDKLRILFDSIDPEGFGEIPVDDFIAALKTPEIQDKVPFNKQELLYERAMKAKKSPGGTVSFQAFVDVMPILRQGATSVTDESKTAVLEAFGLLDLYIRKGYWAAGESLSIADFFLLAVVESVVQLGLSLDSFPNVQDWHKRCHTLPGFDENQEGAKQMAEIIKSKLTEELIWPC